MRVGMNPLRDERMAVSDLPVIAVLVHLPHEQDYHVSRFEIVTASLTLARQSAGTDHHFLIWDNGSSPKMREWLLDFAPDTLILSHNVGVLNAMTRIYHAFRDSVIAWCNDDMLYYPDWLGPQLELLEAFPEGVVSGCVTRYYSCKADENTIEWARKCGKLSAVNTPSLWDMQHGISIGRGKGEAASVFVNAVIPSVEYNGHTALIGGGHCQFVSRAETVIPFLHPTERYMHPLFKTLDESIDAAGILRLMTTKRLTRHLGNVLTDDDKMEINSLLAESRKE